MLASAVVNSVLRNAPYLLAAILAVLLARTGLGFTYLFDDFDFLARAQDFQWSHLLPGRDVLFYRPVSREIYFGFLEFISPGNPIAGHLINAGLLVAIVLLGGALVAEIAGRRAGIVASFVIAAFGQWPVLVGWVCGSQDLLSITFLLLALHSELRGARPEALALFGLSLLSKETAAVTAPALAAVAWIRGDSRRGILNLALQVGALLGIWALIHPGVRALLGSGGAITPGGYIGFDNPARWSAFVESVPALLNLSFLAHGTRWPADLTGVLLLASPIFAALLWFLLRGSGASTSPSPAPGSSVGPVSARCLLLGGSIGVPPLILTCLMLRHWAPYYACFSALGLAVAVAPRLAAMRAPWLVVWSCAFLASGVWSRGVDWKVGVPTERSLSLVSGALRQLEHNFKEVRGTMPNGAIVYVATMATGPRSVYVHLHRFQALRVWYRDPLIRTLRPELHVVSSAPELLFLIDPDLGVFEIDVQSLKIRSAGRLTERYRYRSVLRSYAIGLGMSGQLQRAVDILLGIDEPTTLDHAVSYRLAAMLLYAHGLDSDADAMLRGVPPLPRELALESVRILMTVPTSPPRELERHAFRAFGLSWEDTSALRIIMLGLKELGYRDASTRIAERLLELRPGNVDARRVVEEANAQRERDRLTHEIPAFEAPGGAEPQGSEGRGGAATK